MATPSVTRGELERILTVEERNAIVMRMREGGGPIGKRHAAEVLKVTVEEYDRLCDKAREKIARAKLRRELEPEPARPIAEAAADAAGVERIREDPVPDQEPVRPVTKPQRLSRYRWPNSSRALEAVPIALELLRERGELRGRELCELLNVSAPTFSAWIRDGMTEAGVQSEYALGRGYRYWLPDAVGDDGDTERVPPLPGTRRDMALQTLRRQTEPIRQSKLSEEAGVPTGSIVDVMLSLEREGLAERIERHGGGPSGRGVFWLATPVGSDAGAEQRSEDGDDTAPDIDRGRDPRPANATDAASSAPDHSSVAVGSRNTLSRPCSICGAEPGELHVNPPDDDVESEESPPGTAADLPSAGAESADDEVGMSTDAPGGDITEAEAERAEAAEEMREATEDIPSPDIGLGDPNETVGAHSQQPPEHRELEVREDGTGRAMPPADDVERMAVGNGHANVGGVEVRITQAAGASWPDIYLGVLIGKLQEATGIDETACDRIERVLGIGSGTRRE